MYGTRRSDTGDLLRELQREATSRMAVPDAEAARAADATMRAMQGVDLSRSRGRSRAAAYFWAVVRRRAFSGAPGLGRYRESCIVATLAEDMRCAGHDDQGVSEMLRSLTAVRMAPESDSAYSGATLF